MAGDLAGYSDSNGTNAQFQRPGGLVLDSNNNIFVADTANHSIRKITPQGKKVSLECVADG